MGNKIVTEADRKRTPRPTPMPGMPGATRRRGQRRGLSAMRYAARRTPAQAPRLNRAGT